jgi:hypothetical protein
MARVPILEGPDMSWDTRQPASDVVNHLATLKTSDRAGFLAAVEECVAAHQAVITSIAVKQCNQARRSWTYCGDDLVSVGLEQFYRNLVGLIGDPSVISTRASLATLTRPRVEQKMQQWLVAPQGTPGGVAGTYWPVRRHREFLAQAGVWQQQTGGWPNRATMPEFIVWANERIRTRTKGQPRLLLGPEDAQRPLEWGGDDLSGVETRVNPVEDAVSDIEVLSAARQAAELVLRQAEQRSVTCRVVAAGMLGGLVKGVVARVPEVGQIVGGFPGADAGTVGECYRWVRHRFETEFGMIFR